MLGVVALDAAYLVVEVDMANTPKSSNDDTTDDPTRVKDSWLWVKDSKGFGSVTVTLVTVAFFVTTLAYILSIFEQIGPVTIRQFDVAACSTYFIPILTLYFGRKFTDAKYKSDDSNNNAQG
jgi:hypothetical protein